MIFNIAVGHIEKVQTLVNLCKQFQITAHVFHCYVTKLNSPMRVMF